MSSHTTPRRLPSDSFFISMRIYHTSLLRNAVFTVVSREHARDALGSRAFAGAVPRILMEYRVLTGIS